MNNRQTSLCSKYRSELNRHAWTCCMPVKRIKHSVIDERDEVIRNRCIDLYNGYTPACR